MNSGTFRDLSKSRGYALNTDLGPKNPRDKFAFISDSALPAKPFSEIYQVGFLLPMGLGESKLLVKSGMILDNSNLPLDELRWKLWWLLIGESFVRI